MPAPHRPTRTLRPHPDLDQLKRQARELLNAFAAGTSDAVAEVHAHYHDADPKTFALHDAQLVIARAYGFGSWPKLKAHVEGITVQRLAAAVSANDIDQVRGMLARRPELARTGIDNMSVVHFAVLNRAAEMVRLLMEHGANPREGVYPHRDGTSALTIALDRGYDEIVAAIAAAEQRRRELQTGRKSTPSPEPLFQAILSDDSERAIALMEADPALVHTCHPQQGWTPLHVAARARNEHAAGWLLDHGADAARRAWHDLTPLDMAAHFSSAEDVGRLAWIAAQLIERGAPMTAPAAAALGDAEWLRARQAEGRLTNPIEDTGGLLRIAASHNRPGILELLLDFGFDPDERAPFGSGDDLTFTWGMPLWHCASTGKHAMAEILLRRGADPNGDVYASGTPVYQAYSRGDREMIALLERYGGRANATVAGLFRQRELARRLIDGDAGPVQDGAFAGKPIAEELLWAAACGGDPEIVRLALERIDWPRDDRRWFSALEQAIRVANDGTEPWAEAGWNRSQYAECFGLVLERADPALRGRSQDSGRFGLTILHSVIAARPHVTAAERVTFATMLLDAGAPLDARDHILKSTPLGWACRWGQLELVRLLLARGADPREPDAEPWATPLYWAVKKQHAEIERVLREAGAGT